MILIEEAACASHVRDSTIPMAMTPKFVRGSFEGVLGKCDSETLLPSSVWSAQRRPPWTGDSKIGHGNDGYLVYHEPLKRPRHLQSKKP